MAYANCQNEDCEKDSWWLQKPPSEYASGGPKCPSCGTTRVTIGEASDPAEQTEEATQQRAQEPETRPQTAEPAQQGGEPEQALATKEDAIETGMKVGEMVSGLRAENPEEQAETQGKLLTSAGSAIASMGQKLAERRKQDINRAKNATDDAVAAVDDFVECPNCGNQITELPAPGTQFNCPSCNQLLESQ